MGVDYFPCDRCGEVISDAGDYYRCSQCPQVFCDECKESVKHIYVCQKCHCSQSLCKCDLREVKAFYLCDLCVDGRGPPNNSLIEFLLTKAGFKNLTEAEQAYFSAKEIIPKRTVIKNQDGQVKFVKVDRYGPETDDSFDDLI